MDEWENGRACSALEDLAGQRARVYARVAVRHRIRSRLESLLPEAGDADGVKPGGFAVALRRALRSGYDGKALCHQLARPVDVATRSEYNRHDRQPLNRGRSHAFEARQPVDRGFDRLRDENLDLLRAEAWRFGLDRDLRWRKFREHAVLGIPQ